jgi:muramidase (phage lysozyme)
MARKAASKYPNARSTTTNDGRSRLRFATENEDIQMSTYKGTDDCTDLLLDFIAEPESAGNYNTVIGNAQSTRDLSVLNLAEIDALMTNLLENGQPSTAVGRYQIIRATMRTLKEELQLTDDVKFTPELQDRMAVQLLTGRGYSSWWSGAISDTTLAHGLSCEWASFPDPRNGGQSHYDGIAGNHAGTTLLAVFATLRAAKALQPKEIA